MSCTLFAAMAFCGVAFAQTASHLSIVSGNGQLICISCAYSPLLRFQPLTVRVTDAAGNPVPSIPAYWSVISGDPSSSVLVNSQTITGADGQSSNTVLPEGSGLTVTKIAASALGSDGSVTFTLTQGPSESSLHFVSARVISGLYDTITGTAGGTGSELIQVQIRDWSGQPVPNVSVRLVPGPDYTPGASVACATGAGADPGSVLSDEQGLATCNPLLGPVPGSGTYHVLVGGVQPSTGPAIGYLEFSSTFIQVARGAPGAVKILTGDMQSAEPGQSLAAPLVAEIESSRGYPLAGQPVTWSVIPVGAATLFRTSATSDPNGRVSTEVTLTPSAAEIVQVKATAANNASATFTVRANVSLAGLAKISGDGQIAPLNTAFLQPLVVQAAAAAGGVASGVLVQFSIAGPGTLNQTSATTDADGRAAVTVTAGGTTGAITVTAAAGGISVTFTLTVALAGPVFAPSDFVNGAGFYSTDQSHSALSPCAIGTLIAPGIAPGVQGVIARETSGPLPYQLAQVTVAFNNSQAPLYNVANIDGRQQVAFQVPCDVVPGDEDSVTVTVNGVSWTVNAAVRSAGPGIFEYPMSDGARRAVLTRPDGSFVSLENPAHRGETVRLLGTGIGQVQPPQATNSLPAPGRDSVAAGTVFVSVNNSGVAGVSARRSPSAIGVDEVTFQVPSDAPTGNDVALLLAVSAQDNPQNPQFSNLSKIPIQ